MSDLGQKKFPRAYNVRDSVHRAVVEEAKKRGISASALVEEILTSQLKPQEIASNPTRAMHYLSAEKVRALALASFLMFNIALAKMMAVLF